MRTRRFCQFSLKSLFVAVTLVALPCGFLAWQREIVEERRETLTRIEQLGGCWHDASKNYLGDEGYFGVKITDRVVRHELTWLRRQLGDTGIKSISIPSDSPQEIADRARKLFPEADIYHPDFLKSLHNFNPLFNAEIEK